MTWAWRPGPGRPCSPPSGWRGPSPVRSLKLSPSHQTSPPTVRVRLASSPHRSHFLVCSEKTPLQGPVWSSTCPGRSVVRGGRSPARPVRHDAARGARGARYVRSAVLRATKENRSGAVLGDGVEDSKSRDLGSGISSRTSKQSGPQPGERTVGPAGEGSPERKSFQRRREGERRAGQRGRGSHRALGSALSQLGPIATGGRSLGEEGTRLVWPSHAPPEIS